MTTIWLLFKCKETIAFGYFVVNSTVDSYNDHEIACPNPLFMIFGTIPLKNKLLRPSSFGIVTKASMKPE